jgi:biotin carboxyl carrier protein
MRPDAIAAITGGVGLAALVVVGMAGMVGTGGCRGTSPRGAGPDAARSAAPTAASPATPAPAALRLHGTIEPIRSRIVTVPRLTGTGIGPIIIVHLAKPGTMVKTGDALVEFDRAAQIKAAHDREAEYRDFVEQINKKRADQATSRAKDETELVAAGYAVRSAELDLLDKDLVAPIVSEKNALTLEEARAKFEQLRRTFELKRQSEAADLHILEIERDRALNAWKHAEGNADKMRIVSTLNGLVVVKTTWRQGGMVEVQEGDEVRAGQGIIEVVDPSAMRVRARVNQADIAYVRVGQGGRVTLDSYPVRQFAVRVEQLSPIGATSGFSNRLRTFLAIFSIDGTDPHLLPDLAAAVDLDLPPASDEIARDSRDSRQ